MPKGNPNPVIPPEFKEKQFKRSDRTTEPLAEKILAVRVPVAVDSVVRSLPNKAAWLRRVIVDAAQQELMEGGTVRLGDHVEALSLSKGVES